MTSQPPPDPPTIRFATEEDVPTILSLVHELAAYEHASSSVVATEATLLATLTFPSNPSSGYAKTLLIYPPSPSPTTTTPPNPAQPCAGFALYFPSYSTWRAAPGLYLEDLFVRPAYRGRGYGTALLKRLAQETTKIGGQRLEWSVLKWNEPSIKFYEGVGAKMKNEWVGMRVEGEEVRRMAEDGIHIK
ncbi:hypothetical protein N7G274_009673 [Stereocaulon virgatum]|uniref:N-acetyltransferase domain-containing protein n=1 Tax=Stereocaulon virgatum TaxID=373712 RepID=A0ABR3ZXR7_9LECA